MITDSRTKLRYAAEKLWLKWEDTRSEWNDGASRDFERDHLLPLEPKLAAALRAMSLLSEVMQRAELECRRDP
jgi:hypothetical protein